MAERPIRVQLSRRKGWRMPENTVSVARPGRFGNPFQVGDGRTAEEAVNAFRIWLTVDGCDARMPDRKRAILIGLSSLRGKNLACWCKPGSPCHADVLIEIANAPEVGEG